jgi:hypothetical protein
MDGYFDKQDCCNIKAADSCLKTRRAETPVTSTCLSVDCLEFKTDRMLNKILMYCQSIITFHTCVHLIYPDELEIKHTTESDISGYLT